MAYIRLGAGGIVPVGGSDSKSLVLGGFKGLFKGLIFQGIQGTRAFQRFSDGVSSASNNLSSVRWCARESCSGC